MLLLGRYSTCTTVPRCSPDAFTVTLHTCSSARLTLRHMVCFEWSSGCNVQVCWKEFHYCHHATLKLASAAAHRRLHTDAAGVGTHPYNEVAQFVLLALQRQSIARPVCVDLPASGRAASCIRHVMP